MERRGRAGYHRSDPALLPSPRQECRSSRGNAAPFQDGTAVRKEQHIGICRFATARGSDPICGVFDLPVECLDYAIMLRRQSPRSLARSGQLPSDHRPPLDLLSADLQSGWTSQVAETGYDPLQVAVNIGAALRQARLMASPVTDRAAAEAAEIAGASARRTQRTIEAQATRIADEPPRRQLTNNCPRAMSFKPADTRSIAQAGLIDLLD